MANTFKDKNLALVTAIADRDVAMIGASLKNGADIHYNDDFPLRCAAYLGYVEIVDVLLQKGANVHANGNEPLFTAIKTRDYTLINLLLEKGASLQAVLDTRKDKLVAADLDLIGGLRARDAHAEAEKRRKELQEKARKSPRPILKL